jgi:hypothetical protein
MNRIIKDFNSFKVFESGVSREELKDIEKGVKDIFKSIEVHVKGEKQKFYVDIESNDTKKGRTYLISLALDIDIKKEDVVSEVKSAEKKILKLLPKGTEFVDLKETYGGYARIHYKFITPKELSKK